MSNEYNLQAYFEYKEKLFAPPSMGVTPVDTKSLGCVNATVHTADGRVFNLGRPQIPFTNLTNPLFSIRLAVYKWKRRKELKGHEAKA